MKVIICGAGRVGYGIASRLAGENNTVTVVDLAPDLVRSITTDLDVRGIVGHGAYPDVLKRAGIESADMIIAVTHSDEVNMIACQVAHFSIQCANQSGASKVTGLSRQLNGMICTAGPTCRSTLSSRRKLKSERRYYAA